MPFGSTLIGFFTYHQAVALLLLLLLVGLTAWAPTARARSLGGVLIIAYALVAFYTMMAVAGRHVGF